MEAIDVSWFLTDRSGNRVAEICRHGPQKIILDQVLKLGGKIGRPSRFRRFSALSGAETAVVAASNHQGSEAHPGQSCDSARCPVEGRQVEMRKIGAAIGTGDGNSLGQNAPPRLAPTSLREWPSRVRRLRGRRAYLQYCKVTNRQRGHNTAQRSSFDMLEPNACNAAVRACPSTVLDFAAPD